VKKRKLLVFGVGASADVAAELFGRSEKYSVVGYTIDGVYVRSDSHQGLPVIPFEETFKKLPPEDCDIFVAVGYRNLNKLRADVSRRVEAAGYLCPTLIEDPSRFPPSSRLGKNCLVMAGANVHPFCSIGDDVFMWAGATLCHHSNVGSHGWLTAGSTISGNCKVGDHFFVGANATVVNDVVIGHSCFIGAGALVSSDLTSNSVVVRMGDGTHRLSSDDFLKLVARKGF
jgi:sugar O-acyltransferase (sialic acid O-acetyltransferase NeuD family)